VADALGHGSYRPRSHPLAATGRAPPLFYSLSCPGAVLMDHRLRVLNAGGRQGNETSNPRRCRILYTLTPQGRRVGSDAAPRCGRRRSPAQGRGFRARSNILPSAHGREGTIARSANSHPPPPTAGEIRHWGCDVRNTLGRLEQPTSVYALRMPARADEPVRFVALLREYAARYQIELRAGSHAQLLNATRGPSTRGSSSHRGDRLATGTDRRPGEYEVLQCELRGHYTELMGPAARCAGRPAPTSPAGLPRREPQPA